MLINILSIVLSIGVKIFWENVLATLNSVIRYARIPEKKVSLTIKTRSAKQWEKKDAVRKALSKAANEKDSVKRGVNHGHKR